MNKIISSVIILAAQILLFTACGKDPIPEPSTPTRTLLVYMLADNNLDGYSTQNILEMMEGLDSNPSINANVLIYLDGREKTIGTYNYDGTPQLIRLVRDAKTQKISIQLEKQYEQTNSATTEVMARVIEDMQNAKYEAESYGLILWSHATSWLPIDYYQMTRAFGDDQGQQMEIQEVAQAIPDHLFQYIAVDACAMGSIEVAYELRNKAKYFIASSAEVLAAGFPYETMMPHLLAEDLNPDYIARTFYQFYAASLQPYACISVVDNSELEALAAEVKTILAQYHPYSAFYGIDRSNLQRLSDLIYSPSPLYDFEHTLSKFGGSKEALKKQIELAVPHKYTTDRLIYTISAYSSGYIDVETFSGLSIYPPREDLTELNEWYKSLAWYKAIHD